jgi:dinuclear metal center YbgI/SA1388 family protein
MLEELAPLKYAEEWDNPGLLAGRAEKEVHKIMVALDASEDVIDQAVEENVDMLITHHPMIFKPLKKISTQDFIGKKLVKLIQSDISYYAMHTNFDCAVMAEEAGKRLGLKNRRVLSPVYEEKLFKIAVFVPLEQADKVRAAMTREGAGFIGNYSDCTFNTEGMGTFFPQEGTHPFLGNRGELTRVREIKIETIIEEARKKAVIDAMLKAHPYEEPAYDVYPLASSMPGVGIGCFGYLSQYISAANLAARVKEAFQVPFVTYTGNPEDKIASVAICPGSGKSVIRDALACKADVLITGDMDHHNALDAKEQGLFLMDAGHFGTEHFMAEYVQEYLNQKFRSADFSCGEVRIVTAKEKPVFQIL